MSTFITKVAGACPGDAFLAGGFADMAAYPPKGLGQKGSFMLVDPQPGEDPELTAERLLIAGDPILTDPSGPAGCIPLTEGEYLFFGASR